MLNHANNITIGSAVYGKITVTLDGSLSDRLQELQQFLEGELVVTGTTVIDSTTFAAMYDTDEQPYTEQQIRIRMANRCKNWIQKAVGSDTGQDLNDVDVVMS